MRSAEYRDSALALTVKPCGRFRVLHLRAEDGRVRIELNGIGLAVDQGHIVVHRFALHIPVVHQIVHLRRISRKAGRNVPPFLVKGGAQGQGFPCVDGTVAACCKIDINPGIRILLKISGYCCRSRELVILGQDCLAIIQIPVSVRVNKPTAEAVIAVNRLGLRHEPPFLYDSQGVGLDLPFRRAVV